MGKVGMGASIAAAIVLTVVGCGNMDSTDSFR